MSDKPHFGYTRIRTPLHPGGIPIHLHTLDHLRPKPGDGLFTRFNKRFAVLGTRSVGSMPMFWVFWILCLFVLPSCLQLMNVIHWHFFLALYGFNFLATWFLSTTLELTLMPLIMVGQALQNQAAEARAAKQFEDTELIADRLDEHTAGGIKAVLDAIDALPGRLLGERKLQAPKERM